MTTPTPSQAAEKAIREPLELPPHPEPHTYTWSALEKRCIREWAESQLAELRAEVERLREDSRRLDWLDSLNRRLNAHYQTTYQWKLVLSPNVVRLMSGRFDIDLHDSDAKGVASCRAAIDAALAADGKGHHGKA